MVRSGTPAIRSGKVKRSQSNPVHRVGQPAWVGLLFVAPVVLILLFLIAFPSVASLWYSFTDDVVGVTGKFVGFANYVDLFKNPAFGNSVSNLILIVAVSLLIKLVLGLTIASLLNRPMRAQGVWRAIAFLPWAVPGFVSFMAWRLMFESRSGALDQILSWFGLHVDFFSTPGMARVAVVIATVWAGFPFWVIGILAAMQNIPKELYEAAAMDGANSWHRFMNITMPGIRNTLNVVAVLSTIWTVSGFANVWLITGGGPSDATMVFPVLAYIDLTNFQLGAAAAAAMITLPLFVVLIIWLTRPSREDYL